MQSSDKKKNDSLRELQTALHNLVRKESKKTRFNFDKKYAFEHPNSLHSLNILHRRIHSLEGIDDLKDIKTIYYRLNENLRKTPKGIFIEEEINKFLNTISIGIKGQDFKVKDLEGNTLRLSDFRGKKYVLLHFWATWCGSCITEFPKINNLMNEYGNKLQIINIAVLSDKKVDKIKNMLGKNPLKGIQVSSIQNQKEGLDVIEKKYPIDILPLKFLIDKEGAIIYRAYGNGEEEHDELRYLLEGIQ